MRSMGGGKLKAIFFMANISAVMMEAVTGNLQAVVVDCEGI